MNKFTKAIVRTPSRRMADGLTTANLGKPDDRLARNQHGHYIEALRNCGLDVTILKEDDNFPDSTFVEDTSLLTPHCAIIMNPGAPTRRGEITEIAEVLKRFYQNIEFIRTPGTVEAGDIMMVGSHFFIGLSKRTNTAGAGQLIDLLEKYDMTGSIVPVADSLHLKSGAAYLENDTLVATDRFSSHPEFRKFNMITIDENESYAANCVWINGTVLIPSGFPRTKHAIESRGYRTIEVDVSEFRKLDGGISCLSLRF